MSRRATLCFILSLLRLAVAQRGVFEPFVELTEEIPRTPVEDSHTPALDNFREVGGPGLGFGGACTHDAQCADGLVCIRNPQRGISRCLCSPARPIYIHHADVGKCVRGGSRNLENPPFGGFAVGTDVTTSEAWLMLMYCGDGWRNVPSNEYFLDCGVYASSRNMSKQSPCTSLASATPSAATATRTCSASTSSATARCRSCSLRTDAAWHALQSAYLHAAPGYGQVAAVVTPIVMLSLAALLGIGYLYHRVYRDSWVPAEPHVVAVPSSATIPQVVTRPTQPKPRYIRGLPAAATRPVSPLSPAEGQRSDGSRHTLGSPSSMETTPKCAAASASPPASPRCASSGDELQQGRVTVAVCVARQPSDEDLQSPAGDWTPCSSPRPASAAASGSLSVHSMQSFHSAQSVHSPQSAASRQVVASPQSVHSPQSEASCHRISTADDGQSVAARSPASPSNLPVSYTCVEGSLFAVPPWLAGGANDGVSVSVRGSRVLLEGEVSPRRSRTASSVDDSFMRELKERLRLKALLRLRQWRRERAEVFTQERVNPSERTDDATSTVPPSRQTPATETGHSVESPAARTPASDLHTASESATPSPVFEGRKSGTRSSDRPRQLSALSQTSRREDPLEPVAEEEPADNDGAVSASEASSINSLCCPEDYEESVRHTVALGWDMPAAVVVATTPPESPCSDPHLSVQVPGSADDSPVVSSPVDVAPAFLAPGGNSSAFEAASQSSPAHTNADESRAISQDTVAPVLHGARASLEGPMARTACAGDTWTPESALVLPSPASCSSHYVTPLPIRSRPKGTDIQMSRRSSAVQTEECSSISRATTAKMEDSFCEEYGRGSQMMRVLFAGNAHYLRERSDTFRRASTLDETLYICQQIGQQQDPPMPPRPATAASEVFITRSTTALGSSCEDREPLRLRHLVGLQHPHAYLMANRRRTPIGSHSPSGDEGVNRSSPQLRPMPRPRRLLAVNAEPTGRASDPVVVSESPPRPKPRTRLPLRVPLSLSSTSERHSDSSVLLMPDSTELDWSTTPSTPR